MPVCLPLIPRSWTVSCEIAGPGSGWFSEPPEFVRGKHTTVSLLPLAVAPQRQSSQAVFPEVMKRFASPGQAQQFLFAFSHI
jgi:hypothetical protein